MTNINDYTLSDIITSSNIDPIIYLPVEEYIDSKDKKLELLIDDINILLENNEDIKSKMKWRINRRLVDWYGIIILEGRIHLLNLYFNKIDNNGIKTLKLPSGLKRLHISLHNIYHDDLKNLILPPKLEILLLDYSNISIESLRSLILPSKLEFMRINDIKKEYIQKLIEYSKSPEGIRRYSPIQRYYDYKRCKVIWKEICRGLLFGKTNDPIYKLLKDTYGKDIIRQNVITFHNAFNE